MKTWVVIKPGELKEVSQKVPSLNDDQVLVRNKCFGLNYMDLQQMRVELKDKMPYTPGIEGIGVVENIGDSVRDFKVGDRVGYCTLPYGAFCEKRLIEPKFLVRIPDDISDEVAAAVLFKGMVAHYLLRRVYIIQKTARILVHDADKDIGQIICQWASYFQATIIGTVNSDDRAQIALDNGCEYVVNYQDEHCSDNIMDITEGEGVNVVYDSVGLKTCKLSYQVLSMFGIYALYYNTSGEVPAIDPKIIKSRSTFFTNTSIFHYKSNQFELGMTAMEIFQMIRYKYLKPRIVKTLPFSEIGRVFQDVNNFSLSGQTIIKV